MNQKLFQFSNTSKDHILENSTENNTIHWWNIYTKQKVFILKRMWRTQTLNESQKWQWIQPYIRGHWLCQEHTSHKCLELAVKCFIKLAVKPCISEWWLKALNVCLELAVHLQSILCWPLTFNPCPHQTSITTAGKKVVNWKKKRVMSNFITSSWEVYEKMNTKGLLSSIRWPSAKVKVTNWHEMVEVHQANECGKHPERGYKTFA